MIDFQNNIFLKDYTTLGIGGPAKYFFEAKTVDELEQAIKKAEAQDLQYMVIGAGSNLLVNDSGYSGLVIKNSIKGIKIIREDEITVFTGTALQDLVNFANENGLAGLENMAGIPGTVGGAVYGNAGAYGQTINDHLISAEVLNGDNIIKLEKSQCGFGYRDSIFKKQKNLIIMAIKLKLEKGSPEELKNTSVQVIEKRLQKWKPQYKTPGSFFKNIVVADLSQKILEKIPTEKIVYGKIPAGVLLEETGAKGDKKGGIKIADYHANLFINDNNGTAQDFYDLAMKYKNKVKEKFGIELEPEVQLVGFK